MFPSYASPPACLRQTAAMEKRLHRPASTCSGARLQLASALHIPWVPSLQPAKRTATQHGESRGGGEALLFRRGDETAGRGSSGEEEGLDRPDLFVSLAVEELEQ